MIGFEVEKNKTKIHVKKKNFIKIFFLLIIASKIKNNGTIPIEVTLPIYVSSTQ